MPEGTAVSPGAVDDPLFTEISLLLASNLGLAPGTISSAAETRVLGAIPELDSMSVVTFLISLEEQYGLIIHDDEVDAAIFETVGSLVDFLQSKID